MAEALQGDIATKGDLTIVRSDIETLWLSTKADIEALRLSTKADLEALRLSMKADIEGTKADIIKWMFGTIGFQTLIILGAVVALARMIL